MKTVAALPGIVRRHVASYAEEHHQDISAEINSLSKVSRYRVSGYKSIWPVNHDFVSTSIVDEY